jgi:anti-sigma-K factor RskA
MDYGRSELADALAADYVIGTMRGAAPRRFEALLPAHAGLRRATVEWQERLMPLTQGASRCSCRARLAPSPTAWTDARRRAALAAPVFWRGLDIRQRRRDRSRGLSRQSAPGAPCRRLAGRDTGAAGAAPAAPIVASISGDGTTLVTRPIVPVALRPDRSLELWAVPKDGSTPRSLGVLPAARGATVALRAKVLADVDTLAVTIEPPGGSPTGKPTGPIVYAGKFSL